MKQIKLKRCRQDNAILLDHEFIDQYMPEANGEYVKVYLLLLRLLNDAKTPLTISGIADILDDTEKDVIRALKYWKKQGLLDYETFSTPTAVPDPKITLWTRVRPFPLNRRRILFPAQAARIPALCQTTISLSSATERS